MGIELNNYKLDIDEKGIALLTIDKESSRNSLDEAAWRELGSFMDYVEKEASIKAVVITGAGQKSFASGADIKMLEQKTGIDMLSGMAQKSLDKIEQCGKAVIAAINGYALGGGCELALACDIRIVSQNAKLGLPELSLGIIPGCGGTQRLARIVGLGRAKEIILMGRVLSGEEAVSAGMAFKCVPVEDVVSEAKKCADIIAAKGPLAVKLAKKAIRASMSSDQESGMLIEILSNGVLCGSEDKKEGVQAFLEKRSPNYSGR